MLRLFNTFLLAAGVGSSAPASINVNHIHSACALNLRMQTIPATSKTIWK